MKTRVQNRNNFSVKAQADGLHLYFYGDIVGTSKEKWSYEDTAPVDVRDALAKAGDGTIILHINSGGGDFFAAIAICSMLAGKPGKKICYIEGLAASAASVIALSCDEVYMPANTMLMIHRSSNDGYGNAEWHLQMAELLEKVDSQMLDVYTAHSGTERDRLKAMMEAETWLTADEAAGYFSNVSKEDALSAVAKVKLPKSAPAVLAQLMEQAEAEKLRLQLELIE